jgi:hypothetical protein
VSQSEEGREEHDLERTSIEEGLRPSSRPWVWLSSRDRRSSFESLDFQREEKDVGPSQGLLYDRQQGWKKPTFFFRHGLGGWVFDGFWLGRPRVVGEFPFSVHSPFPNSQFLTKIRIPGIIPIGFQIDYFQYYFQFMSPRLNTREAHLCNCPLLQPIMMETPGPLPTDIEEIKNLAAQRVDLL